MIVQKVQNHAEVVDDPQSIANEYVVPMTFDGVGESRVVGNQIQLSKTPGSVKRPPPRLGQDTRDVMQRLGYSNDEITSIESHTAEIRKAVFGE